MNRICKYTILMLVVICSFAIFTSKVNAATYYVNHTLGTNDVAHGTGIDANAWATLKYALTGSRVAKGDTIYVQAGTWAEDQITVVVGAGTGGAVTVDNYNNDVVTIQTGVVVQGLVQTNSVDMIFDGINIDNNNVAMAGLFLFGLYSTTTTVDFTFQNATINGRNSSGYIRSFKLYGSQPHNLIINKANIINGGYTIDVQGTSGLTNTVNIYSSVISDEYQIFNANATSPTSLTMLNNAFGRASSREFYLYPAGTSVVAKNNIFLAGGSYSDIIFDLAGTFGPDAIANHSIFDVSYNYYYSEDGSFTGLDTYISIIRALTVVPYIPKENWFVNPSFTALGTDYTLQAGSLIAGRGTNQHPPDGTDINGVAYGANDVGPYVNPTLTALPALSTSEVAWYGDSIMNGSTASSEDTKGYSVFGDNTGKTVVNYAVGGHTTGFQFWTVDQSIWTGREATAIVAIGINDLQAPKSSQTNAQVSNMIITILNKLESAGIEPVSMGMSSIYGTPPDNTNVDVIVDSVQTECTSQGWSCGSILDQMRNSATWSTDYYADITTDVHPNDSGHAEIARLAEYLYYTKHIIGTDEVDVGAGARIFADGKFRDLGTTSGVTASFIVTPVGGVGAYDADNASAYMDVVITTWDTSGSKNKAWTASSSTGAGYSQAGSTVYTIGDLSPSSRYQFKLDGTASTTITGSTCSGSICWSDSSGMLTFTYTGGYSSHTFALNRLTNASVATTVPISEITISKLSDEIIRIINGTGTCKLGLNPGDEIEIYWSSNSSVQFVNLFYSTDDGEVYTKIAGPIANIESYTWTVPQNITGSKLQFKIEGTDLAQITTSFETEACLLNGQDEVLVGDVTDGNPDSYIDDQTGASISETGFSPVTGEPEDISVVSVGDFIKSPYFSTVYYVTSELTRRPFMDSRTFFTYADSFAQIKTVTDATLTILRLGSAMLPNPGIVLVKIQSDPRTYAVDNDNNLRWITSETVAMSLYGSNWADYIIDIEPTFFSKFGQGEMIASASSITVSDTMKTGEELK